jgi:MarR family transcriptional regulator, organic hydroperoxide resistance regulator
MFHATFRPNIIEKNICKIEMTKNKPLTKDANLIDQHLCFSLYSASLSMTKAYITILKPLGITYPQYAVMMCLWDRDGITVTELGSKLFLDTGTLTPLLKRLETSALISRVRSEEDNRKVIVRLAKKGQQLKRKQPLIDAKIIEVIKLNKATRAGLTAQLVTLRDNLARSTVSV